MSQKIIINKNSQILTIALLSALFLSACSRTESIGTYGKKDIPASDISSFLNGLTEKEKSALLSENQEVIKQTVQTYLLQKQIRDEAYAKGWEQKQDVKIKLDRARENALVELYLQSIAAPDKNFPTEELLRKSYEANKDSLKVPRLYKLAQIYIAISKDATQEVLDNARAKVETVQKALQSGADFSAQASTWSDDKKTAPAGGVIGWLPESQIHPEIRSRVLALPRGGTSEPIRLVDGWHIVRLVDIREPGTATYDEVKNSLTQRLRAEKEKSNRQAYVASILKQNPIHIDEAKLTKLLAEENKK